MTAVCTEVWRDHVCDNCGLQEDAPGHFSVSRDPYAYKPEGRYADHPSPAWAIICNNPRWAQATGYSKTLTEAEEAFFCKAAKPCDHCFCRTDSGKTVCCDCGAPAIEADKDCEECGLIYGPTGGPFTHLPECSKVATENRKAG